MRFTGVPVPLSLPADPVRCVSGAPDAFPWAGSGLPEQQRRRLLSLRGYDAQGMSTVAEVVPGADVEARLETVLADGRTDFVHLHNAGPGCFAARVDR